MKKTESASASSAFALPASNVFSKACPSREVLDVLGSKWTLLIVHALASGAMRTGELRRRVEGISDKMLSQTLKELERLKIVTRTDYREVPPRVDYALTSMGVSLCQIVKSLDRWVQEHAPALTSAD